MSKKLLFLFAGVSLIFLSCSFKAWADNDNEPDTPVAFAWSASCSKGGYSWYEFFNDTEGSEEVVTFSLSYSCWTKGGIKSFKAYIIGDSPLVWGAPQESYPYISEVPIYVPAGDWNPALDESGIPIIGYAIGTTGGQDFRFVVPEHNLLIDIDCENGSENYYFDLFGGEYGEYYGTLRHHYWSYSGISREYLIRLKTIKSPAIEPDYMDENNVNKYGYYVLAKSQVPVPYNNHVTVTLETLPSSTATYGTDYHLWWGYLDSNEPNAKISFTKDSLATAGPNIGRVIIPAAEEAIKIYVRPKWDSQNEGSETVNLQIRHVCVTHSVSTCNDQFEFDGSAQTITIVDPQ